MLFFFSGTVRLLTHWEQLDHGLQYTPTRKFLTIIPILLFFLASFYTHYQSTHFLLNSISLAFVLVRIFTFSLKKERGIEGRPPERKFGVEQKNLNLSITWCAWCKNMYSYCHKMKITDTMARYTLCIFWMKFRVLRSFCIYIQWSAEYRTFGLANRTQLCSVH